MDITGRRRYRRPRSWRSHTAGSGLLERVAVTVVVSAPPTRVPAVRFWPWHVRRPQCVDEARIGRLEGHPDRRGSEGQADGPGRGHRPDVSAAASASAGAASPGAVEEARAQGRVSRRSRRRAWRALAGGASVLHDAGARASRACPHERTETHGDRRAYSLEAGRVRLELRSVARHGGSDAVAATTDFARGQANVSDRGGGDATEEGPRGRGGPWKRSTPMETRPRWIETAPAISDEAEGSYEEFPDLHELPGRGGGRRSDNEAGTPRHGLVVTQGLRAAAADRGRSGCCSDRARVESSRLVYGGGCTGGWRQLGEAASSRWCGVEVGGLHPTTTHRRRPRRQRPLPFNSKVTHDATPFSRLPTFGEQGRRGRGGSNMSASTVGSHADPASDPDEVPAVVRYQLGLHVTRRANTSGASDDSSGPAATSTREVSARDRRRYRSGAGADGKNGPADVLHPSRARP